jgi:diadenosine tetraphosphate (Ap4A) HIT family hydrolase
MAKTSIDFAKLAVENPDDIDELWKALKKVERAMKKADTVLYRAEYY